MKNNHNEEEELDRLYNSIFITATRFTDLHTYTLYYGKNIMFVLVSSLLAGTIATIICISSSKNSSLLNSTEMGIICEADF